MKYETGPWKACPCECGQIWSVPYDYPVAKMNTEDHIDGETVRYTERIIEAAPDMLEFIRGIADDKKGYRLDFVLLANEIVNRIDNPPQNPLTSDHRSPFEKMTATSDCPGSSHLPSPPCSASDASR